jgi:GDPmannose 4,6-dehydratase
MHKQTAVIVGGAGQDGRLLAERLRNLEYEVIALDRHALDITVLELVTNLICEVKPNEIYYLAAYHHSSEDINIDKGELFRNSFNIHTLAAANFLHAISMCSPASRFFYASSCLIFPPNDGLLQTELTTTQPESPYAISKEAGMAVCRFYREKRGVFACSGILYNHESPLRNSRFVTKKIAAAAAQISKHGADGFVVGDIEAKVDWGYAPDYVDAMHKILQTGYPQDYIVATGRTHTVREFAEIAFRHVGLDYKNHVSVSSEILTRRNLTRIGDATRLRFFTGWKPSVSFEEMVCIMVDAELEI